MMFNMNYIYFCIRSSENFKLENKNGIFIILKIYIFSKTVLNHKIRTSGNMINSFKKNSFISKEFDSLGKPRNINVFQKMSIRLLIRENNFICYSFVSQKKNGYKLSYMLNKSRPLFSVSECLRYRAIQNNNCLPIVLQEKHQISSLSLFRKNKNNMICFALNKQSNHIPFFNFSFDKGRLKAFVLWFLKNYGQKKTVQLLEQLKEIGFGYATKAGISLGIDDLKIPPQKLSLLKTAGQKVDESIIQYKRGEITGVERLQRFIDTWHQTSETLKQEVVRHFEATDILNPVYMMAFSGARGNLSQVRQLVGMRGLMADPQGQIIDFPIRSNFREGLTLTEYVISTYGARKGIVDTALRTANAGYLTRRLVDVAQHVIVSEFDCGTNRGILVFEMKEGTKTIYPFQNRLIGRVLAKDVFSVDENGMKQKMGSRNQEIYLDLANTLAQITKKVLIRSPLTCQTRKFVCQLCYGWSLSHNRLVSIGEAVGIIAAQSIGEPGTQLTMRTFHTGGVFSGGITDQIIAQKDGIVEYSNPIAGTLVRTPQGQIAFLTKSEGSLILKTFLKTNQPDSTTTFDSDKTSTETIKNELHSQSQQNLFSVQVFKIPPFSLLFIKHNQKVTKKQLVAQLTSFSSQRNQKGDAEQTIFSEYEGEIYNSNVDIIEKLSEYDDINLESWGWGYMWILSGKVYQVPIDSYLLSQPADLVNQNSILNRISWVSPNSSFLIPKTKETSSGSFNFQTNKTSLPTLSNSFDAYSQNRHKMQKFTHFNGIGFGKRMFSEKTRQKQQEQASFYNKTIMKTSKQNMLLSKVQNFSYKKITNDKYKNCFSIFHLSNQSNLVIRSGLKCKLSQIQENLRFSEIYCKNPKMLLNQQLQNNSSMKLYSKYSSDSIKDSEKIITKRMAWAFQKTGLNKNFVIKKTFLNNNNINSENQNVGIKNTLFFERKGNMHFLIQYNYPFQKFVIHSSYKCFYKSNTSKMKVSKKVLNSKKTTSLNLKKPKVEELSSGFSKTPMKLGSRFLRFKLLRLNTRKFTKFKNQTFKLFSRSLNKTMFLNSRIFLSCNKTIENKIWCQSLLKNSFQKNKLQLQSYNSVIFIKKYNLIKPMKNGLSIFNSNFNSNSNTNSDLDVFKNKFKTIIKNLNFRFAFDKKSRIYPLYVNTYRFLNFPEFYEQNELSFCLSSSNFLVKSQSLQFLQKKKFRSNLEQNRQPESCFTFQKPVLTLSLNNIYFNAVGYNFFINFKDQKTNTKFFDHFYTFSKLSMERNEKIISGSALSFPLETNETSSQTFLMSSRTKKDSFVLSKIFEKSRNDNQTAQNTYNWSPFSSLFLQWLPSEMQRPSNGIFVISSSLFPQSTTVDSQGLNIKQENLQNKTFTTKLFETRQVAYQQNIYYFVEKKNRLLKSKKNFLNNFPPVPSKIQNFYSLPLPLPPQSLIPPIKDWGRGQRWRTEGGGASQKLSILNSLITSEKTKLKSKKISKMKLFSLFEQKQLAISSLNKQEPQFILSVKLHYSSKNCIETNLPKFNLNHTPNQNVPIIKFSNALSVISPFQSPISSSPPSPSETPSPMERGTKTRKTDKSRVTTGYKFILMNWKPDCFISSVYYLKFYSFSKFQKTVFLQKPSFVLYPTMKFYNKSVFIQNKKIGPISVHSFKLFNFNKLIKHSNKRETIFHLKQNEVSYFNAYSKKLNSANCFQFNFNTQQNYLQPLPEVEPIRKSRYGQSQAFYESSNFKLQKSKSKLSVNFYDVSWIPQKHYKIPVSQTFLNSLKSQNEFNTSYFSTLKSTLLFYIQNRQGKKQPCYSKLDGILKMSLSFLKGEGEKATLSYKWKDGYKIKSKRKEFIFSDSLSFLPLPLPPQSLIPPIKDWGRGQRWRTEGGEATQSKDQKLQKNVIAHPRPFFNFYFDWALLYYGDRLIRFFSPSFEEIKTKNIQKKGEHLFLQLKVKILNYFMNSSNNKSFKNGLGNKYTTKNQMNESQIESPSLLKTTAQLLFNDRIVMSTLQQTSSFCQVSFCHFKKNSELNLNSNLNYKSNTTLWQDQNINAFINLNRKKEYLHSFVSTKKVLTSIQTSNKNHLLDIQIQQGWFYIPCFLEQKQVAMFPFSDIAPPTSPPLWGKEMENKGSVNYSERINQTYEIHESIVGSGKFVLDDIVFENRRVYVKCISIETNVISNNLDDKLNFLISKSRFLKKPSKFQKIKTIFTNNKIRFQPKIVKESKIALLILPMQYKLLPSLHSYKRKLHQYSTKKGSSGFSSLLKQTYHSSILNKQLIDNQLVSSYPAPDFEILSSFQTKDIKQKLKSKTVSASGGFIWNFKKSKKSNTLTKVTKDAFLMSNSKQTTVIGSPQFRSLYTTNDLYRIGQKFQKQKLQKLGLLKMSPIQSAGAEKFKLFYAQKNNLHFDKNKERIYFSYNPLIFGSLRLKIQIPADNNYSFNYPFVSLTNAATRSFKDLSIIFNTDQPSPFIPPTNHFGSFLIEKTKSQMTFSNVKVLNRKLLSEFITINRFRIISSQYINRNKSNASFPISSPHFAFPFFPALRAPAPIFDWGKRWGTPIQRKINSACLSPIKDWGEAGGGAFFAKQKRGEAEQSKKESFQKPYFIEGVSVPISEKEELNHKKDGEILCLSKEKAEQMCLNSSKQNRSYIDSKKYTQQSSYAIQALCQTSFGPSLNVLVTQKMSYLLNQRLATNVFTNIATLNNSKYSFVSTSQPFLSIPVFKNQLLLNYSNFVSNTKSFAFTSFFSPLKGEMLPYSVNYWTDSNTTTADNSIQKKQILFLTKSDLFCVSLNATNENYESSLSSATNSPFKNSNQVISQRSVVDSLNNRVPQSKIGESQTAPSFPTDPVFRLRLPLPKGRGAKQKQSPMFDWGGIDKIRGPHPSYTIQHTYKVPNNEWKNYLIKKHQHFLQCEVLLKQKYKTKISKSTTTLIKHQRKLYKVKGLNIGRVSPFKDRYLRIGSFLVYGDIICPNYAIDEAGQIIHMNSQKITLRYAQAVAASPKGILHAYSGDFIRKQCAIMTLPFQTLKTGDIVQGIPKVEQYFEARTSKQGRLFRDSLPNLLQGLFERYLTLFASPNAQEKAVRYSLLKLQQIIVDGVQRVYRSQGVSIVDKHLEIVVRQMTSKVQVVNAGQTGFFPGEFIDIEFAEHVNSFLLNKIKYEPVVLGITRASLEVDSFLSAASFQQTTKILSKAALYKKKDFLKGLKENLMIGNLIPAGTGYLVTLHSRFPIFDSQRE